MENNAPLKLLDIGCGKRKLPGSVGIDIMKDSQADIVWDLNSFPWPIEDNSFDKISCSHILEHLQDVVKVMEEIHRVAKPGAKVDIEVPHFSDPGAFQDPTHRHYFTYFTFDYFTGNPMYPGYTPVRFSIEEKKFKALSGMNRFLSTRLEPRLYEERFARVFPSFALSVSMRVIK